MNERGFDRIARDFMSDGPTVLADRVFDAALREVHLTRQRRGLRLGPWRFPNMNTFAKAAVGAVAVISVAYVGLNVLGPDNSGVGAVPSPGPSATVAPTATPAPTLTPTPTPTATPLPSAPPLTGQFTSEHGFSISYPETWSTRPASEPWTSGFVDFGQPGADLIYDPVVESDLFLALASQPLGDRSPAAWTTEMWGVVTADDAANASCAEEADPITVGGAAGVRCNDLVLVTAGGRGYWFQLYTSSDDASLDLVYDAEWFGSVLETVELQPEQATD
jgi:hypothetical protein